MTPLKAGKYTSIFVAAILLPASLWYLVEKFQWSEAFCTLRHTDFVTLIAAVYGIHFVYICVRTWRWRVVVRHANPNVSFLDLYWISAIVVSLSIITPGQLGEAIKTDLLKRRGLLGRLPGLGGFAVERILDLLAVAFLACFGLLFGSGLGERFPALAATTGVLFLLALSAVYFLLSFDPGGRVSSWVALMRTGTGSPEGWAKMAIATILAWGLVSLGWQVSLTAVGVHLSLPEVLWLLATITLGTLLSFIPGGVGVAEFIALAALVNLGTPDVPAQAGALILRAYGLIVISFGLIHLLLWVIFNYLCLSRDSSHQG